MEIKTIRDMAKITNKEYGALIQQVRRGRLPVKRAGRFYYVDDISAFKTALTKIPGRGRPRKTKT